MEPLYSLCLQQNGRGPSVKSNCARMAEGAAGLKSAPSWKCLFVRAESICRGVLLTLISQRGGNFHISLRVHDPTPLCKLRFGLYRHAGHRALRCCSVLVSACSNSPCQAADARCDAASCRVLWFHFWSAQEVRVPAACRSH